MKKIFLTGSTLLFLGMILVLGCNKTETPYGISAPNGLDVPSPTATPIVGKIFVAVSDLDKGYFVDNINVQAIQPDGSVTYSGNTGLSGVAAFNPPTVQPGSWTFVIPAQGLSFPYATSYMNKLINTPNETVTFAAGQATFALTPTSATQYTSNTGGVFTYNLVYSQPNPLLIPVALNASSVYPNWAVNFQSVTIGSTGTTQIAVTVSGSVCIDQIQPVSITGIDSSAFVRGVSNSVSVTKSFTSNITASVTTNELSYYAANAGCYNCSGYPENRWHGTVNITLTNNCGPLTVVGDMGINSGGLDCSTFFYFNNTSFPNGCSRPGSPVTAVIHGNSTIPLDMTDIVQHSNPTLYLKIMNDVFPNGIAGSAVVLNGGTAGLINQSY